MLQLVHHILLCLLGAWVLLGASVTRAQPVPDVVPGDTVLVAGNPAGEGRPAGVLGYRVDPASGLRTVDERTGDIRWKPSDPPALRLPVRFALTPNQSASPLEVAPVRVMSADSTRDAVPVPVQAWNPQRPDSAAVSAAPLPDSAAAPTSLAARPTGQENVSIPVGGLVKEVEVELYGSTRATSPGGLVIIRYSINSYEDQDERVRLRLLLPASWTLLDRDIEEKEFLLEAWETVEGEIRVAVPQDARPGERHLVRVIGEVIGEPGGAEVFSYVQIVKRGGLKPGAVGLTGTASLLATSLAVEDLGGARYGGVVDLSGKLTRQTTLSLNYRQGPRESDLTNYRIAQEETRWSGTLRNRSWTLQFGNQINSTGNVLTGPYVRGRGLSLRRTEGRLVGDLTVAEPTSFIDDPAGHVVRGSVGVSGTVGRVALAFSDFARPGGGYSTAPRYPEDLDPDELERLERERKALEKASRNRVQGAGLDVELQHAKIHRLNLRGGWLRLTNAAGDTTAGPSAEAQYSLNHPRANVTARWRQMPSSLQGIYLPGNEMAVDASLRVIGDWRLAGRAYRTLNQTLGNSYHSEGEGASFGVRYTNQAWRMELRANQRTWSYGQEPTVARTVNLSFGLPVGPLSFSAYAERGAQRRDTLRQPAASYRTDLRWSGNAGSTVSWGTSYYETLNSPPRLRTDVLGSVKLGEWELAGGAWATMGLKTGGEPGFWSQIGVPVSYDLLLTLGIEHAPPGWGQPPAWMGTVGIRKKMAFPIPFLRDGSISRTPAISSPLPAASD